MGNRVTEVQRKTVLVDGLVTGYLEAGQGDPVVLLHGGEFGVSAEIGWEHNIAALAAHHRVLAPDMLGFGESAKVDRLQRRPRHADPAHRPVLRRCRCRVRALRRQLDGRGQPVRRRHLGLAGAAGRAAW